MSATSEELAAQSEQLQASIAYFRVDATDSQRRPVRQPAAPMDAAAPVRVAQRRTLRTAMPVLAIQKPRAEAHKPLAARNKPGNGHDRAAAKGFGLDLTQPADDHHDADFVKY
jgi:methyl-accepting chemotaxis protein